MNILHLLVLLAESTTFKREREESPKAFFRGLVSNFEAILEKHRTTFSASSAFDIEKMDKEHFQARIIFECCRNDLIRREDETWEEFGLDMQYHSEEWKKLEIEIEDDPMNIEEKLYDFVELISDNFSHFSPKKRDRRFLTGHSHKLPGKLFQNKGVTIDLKVFVNSFHLKLESFLDTFSKLLEDFGPKSFFKEGDIYFQKFNKAFQEGRIRLCAPLRGIKEFDQHLSVQVQTSIVKKIIFFRLMSTCFQLRCRPLSLMVKFGMLGYFWFHNQDSTMQTMERVKIQKEESTKICVGYLIYRIVLFFFVSDPDAFVLSHIHLVSVFYLTIFRFDEIANFACRRYKTMDPKSRKIQSNLVLLQPLLRPTIWSQMIAFEPFNIAYDVLLCSFQAFLCRERDFESGATLCVTSESLLAEMKKRLSFDRQRRHLKFADRRHLKFAVGIMVLTSADLLVRLPIPIPFRFF
jgi:hypothetical protein